MPARGGKRSVGAWKWDPSSAATSLVPGAEAASVLVVDMAGAEAVGRLRGLAVRVALRGRVEKWGHRAKWRRCTKGRWW
eukprot:617305-Pelagomonas_calceolata.AAC.2